MLKTRKSRKRKQQEPINGEPEMTEAQLRHIADAYRGWFAGYETRHSLNPRQYATHRSSSDARP